MLVILFFLLFNYNKNNNKEYIRQKESFNCGEKKGLFILLDNGVDFNFYCYISIICFPDGSFSFTGTGCG